MTSLNQSEFYNLALFYTAVDTDVMRLAINATMFGATNPSKIFCNYNLKFFVHVENFKTYHEVIT